MKTVSEETAEKKFGVNWDGLCSLSDDGKKVGSADWRESVDEVLKVVDKQVKEFGLEVVQIETGTDTYMWYLQKREKETKKVVKR